MGNKAKQPMRGATRPSRVGFLEEEVPIQLCLPGQGHSHGPTPDPRAPLFFLKKQRPRETTGVPLVTWQSLLVAQRDILGF